MARLRTNILSNLFGQTINVLVAFLATPIYLHFLGIESYGLIGFYLSIQTFFVLLDFGLSTALSREFARFLHTEPKPDLRRDLVRTVEWIYWPIGGLIAVAAYFGSDALATHWLNSVNLPSSQIADAIMLMGATTALQWPSAVYQSAFRGMEQQLVPSAITAISAVLRAGGCIVVLLFVSQTLSAFLLWQGIVACVSTVTLRGLLWRSLGAGTRRAAFQGSLLRALREFSAGLTAVSALSLLLMQSDRVILSKILPLDQLGYYMVATTVAGALSGLVGPFFYAVYPRFSGIVSSGNEARLASVYHSSSQWFAACLIPVSMVLMIFSADILLLWTHDAVIAARSAYTLSILVAGTAINGLAHMPYAVQLAYGWTRFALIQNLIAVFLVIPALFWVAPRYGGVGAALVWTALNAGYLTISMPLMHRHFLPKHLRSWYLQDILPPTAAVLVVTLGLRYIFPTVPNGAWGVIAIGLFGTCSLVAGLLAAAAPRSALLGVLRRIMSAERMN